MGRAVLLVVAALSATAGALGAASVPASARVSTDPVIMPSSVLQADETDAIVTVDFTSDQPSHWYVEWGNGTSYGSQGRILSGSAGETQTSAVLGPSLQAGTLYHFRVVVLLFDGVTWSRTFDGPDTTVTTKAAPATGPAPTITNAVAIRASLTCNCFDIRANVDTRDASTVLTLAYGTTSSLGSTAALTTLPGVAGVTYVDAVQGPTGLTPGTTYFWQLVATNAAGSTASDIQTIDLPAEPVNVPPAHNPDDCVPGHTTWLRWTAEPLRATAGEPFSASLGSGGTPKYTVMGMDDATPEWLTVDDLTLALSGTPPQAGVYRFSWCVVDSTGQAAGIVVEIDVAAAPTVPPTTTPPPATSAAPPVLIRPATLSGRASVGYALHLLRARWKIQPIRMTFQWEVETRTRSWRPIRGATHQTLTLASSLARRRVRGTELAWFARGATARAASRSLLVAR